MESCRWKAAKGNASPYIEADLHSSAAGQFAFLLRVIFICEMGTLSTQNGRSSASASEVGFARRHVSPRRSRRSSFRGLKRWRA